MSGGAGLLRKLSMGMDGAEMDGVPTAAVLGILLAAGASTEASAKPIIAVRSSSESALPFKENLTGVLAHPRILAIKKAEGESAKMVGPK